MLTRLTQFQSFWTTRKHFVSYVKHFTNFKPLIRYICNYQPKHKYNTSVDNTTLYLYKKIAYFVRSTCFDLIRSSSGLARRQIQELFMLHCIMGSQMLTRFCWRSVKLVSIWDPIKIAYFVRATCFDLIRSSSGPARRQIQELFMLHCIVGS